MSFYVHCPDPTMAGRPVGEFDSANDAEMWLEVAHCNQLAESDGAPVGICAAGATPDEHELEPADERRER